MYADVLKNIPVEKATCSQYDVNYYPNSSSVEQSVHGKIAEYRDVENGNTEVYLMEDTNVISHCSKLLQALEYVQEATNIYQRVVDTPLHLNHVAKRDKKNLEYAEV